MDGADPISPARFAHCVVEASTDALLAVDETGTVRFWSPGARAMFGYDAAEAMGRTIFELIVPPGQAAATGAHLAESLQQGAFAYECMRRRKDGSLLHVDLTATVVRTADGRVDFIMVSLKDVTAIRSLQQARRLRTRFGALLDFAPDAMVIVNPFGRIVFANAQADRLFGYADGELLGMSIEVLVPERYRAAHIAHRLAYFGEPRRRAMGMGLELYGLRKDGAEFPVEISLSPIDTEDGTLVMSAIRDVTDRRRSQQALADQERALEEAREELLRKDRLALIGQLAGGVSHELRNPLGVIKNSVYYLKMLLPGDERVAKHLRILEREVATANRIVTGLLDFARMTPPNRVATDLGAVTLEVLERFPAPGHVSVRTALAAALPRVVLDPDQLQLVLGNLVMNAVQAMPEGGTLTVETSAIPGGAMVAVADTGVGIPVMLVEKIFEPLFTTKAKGIGLGLAVARAMAEANGGRITVKSAPGMGSRFEVHFTGSTEGR
jgi:PAS domain S-box-containing protein